MLRAILFVLTLNIATYAQPVESMYIDLKGNIKNLVQEKTLSTSGKTEPLSYIEMTFKKSFPHLVRKYKSKKKLKSWGWSEFNYQNNKIQNYKKFNSKEKKIKTITFSYNGELLIKKYTEHHKFKQIDEVIMAYDSDKILIKKFEVTIKDNERTRSHVDIKYKDHGKRVIKSSYNAKKSLIHKATLVLNDKQQVISEEVKRPKSPSLNSKFRFKYDSQGNMTSTKSHLGVTEINEYTYDSNANWIKRISYSNDLPKKKTTTIRTITYQSK